jgi:hypothetical protein
MFPNHREKADRIESRHGVQIINHNPIESITILTILTIDLKQNSVNLTITGVEPIQITEEDDGGRSCNMALAIIDDARNAQEFADGLISFACVRPTRI